jgi:hypothetical protein
MFWFLNKLCCGLESSSLGSQLNHGIMRCENVMLVGACFCTEVSWRVTSWYTHTRELAGINPGPSRPERDVWLVGCTKRAMNSLLSAWLLSVWYRHVLPVGLWFVVPCIFIYKFQIKQPTRSTFSCKILYCLFIQTLLNMFRATFRPSSGALFKLQSQPSVSV